MIKVEYKSKERNCTIKGCATDIALELTAIFEALSEHEQTKLILLACIDAFLTTNQKKY